MIELSVYEAAKALNVEQYGEDVTFTGVSIDTRTILPGNLFVAIKGENFDGHEFINKAEENGAAALLVERKVNSYLPQIIVPSTHMALGELARYWREKFTLPIVGITGSAGKTTTKQMMGAILGQSGNTLIPEGNKNNYYGVPLTLFKLGLEHAYAVIEMGADRPGEISYLANIVQPTVSIITNVAAVHIEVAEGVGFGSVEGVFKEKSQIFANLPSNGFAIINADDAFFPQWQQNLISQNRLSFGLEGFADVTAENLQANTNMQYNFDLITPVGSINLTLSSIGKHNVMNALAASAAAVALNIPLGDIKVGLEAVPLVEKRMVTYAGKKGALIIDDSYNANVKSVPAVMEVLADFPGRSKRIMIFGDMLEIGPTSLTEHFKIGEKAKVLKINYFYTFGTDSYAASQAYGDAAKHFTEQTALINDVLPLLDENTIVVVKGSRGMKMENIVKELSSI